MKIKYNKNNKKSNTKKVKIPNYKLEKSNKIEITANSGLFLLGEYIKQAELIDNLNELSIFERRKIEEGEHILSLVLNQFSGGDAIRDTQYLRKDEALKKIFDDIHIPAPHTSGDFLERFTEELIEELRTILHKHQDKTFKKLRERLGKRITISGDSSVYEVYGNCKERTSMSYKNIFGYHPLLLHINDTGELLDIYLRGGNSYTSEQIIEMLRHNITRLARYFEEILFLGDSGFFDQKIIRYLKKLEKELSKKYNRAIEVRFVITGELNKPIQRALPDPSIEWTKYEEPKEEGKEIRNSRTINYRLKDLQERLRKKNKALKIRDKMEIGEFRHIVPSWGEEYRFVFKRQKILTENMSEQYELIEAEPEYFYHGYVTNLEEDTKEEIVKQIDGRGNEEKFIEDFKNGLGTVHIPTKHFYGNYAYFLISMLSWNLKYWILYIISPDNLIRWKRFRYLYIKVGAQIIKSGHNVIIRFGRGFHRFKEFLKHHERLKQYQYV